MKTFRIVSRIFVIYYVLARYRVNELVLHSDWFNTFRFLNYLNPMRYLPTKKLSRAQRLRLALERLGPIFVKFGQVLSTRRDLLPSDIADELANLQDQVKPFSGKKAREIIEESLGKPIQDIFKSFDETALASASIAQVHAATLYSEEQVVIKVLRPGIGKQISRDIEVLKALAKLTHYLLPSGRKLRAQEIVEEFEASLNAELDLMQEAANATTLRRQFVHSSLLYIPEVYWDYCQKDVMVMERIFGVPAYDISTLKTKGYDLKKLAENVLEIFFTQVFKNNFFHADMHPGNLFVSNVNRQQFIAVDFGIVSSLTESDRRYIAENLLAFFHRDYRRVAELHIASGWVNADIRITEFEAAIRAVSEPVFEKPLKQISMGQLIMNLIRVARAFNIKIQPQLILLQKTLLNVEGLGRQLDPDLDLWSTAKPFLEKWLRQQMGPKAFLKKVKEQLPFWLEKLPDMPDLIYQALLNAKQPAKPMQPVEEKEKTSSMDLLTGIGAAFMMSTVIVSVVENNIGASSYIFFTLGVVAFVARWFYIRCT